MGRCATCSLSRRRLRPSSALSAPADASRFVRYGLQDDAWLVYGPGIARRADRQARPHRRRARPLHDQLARDRELGRAEPDWERADAILRGLDKHGIVPVVTIWGTPRWANGGRSPNWAPRSKWTFAGFARRAADRYPFVPQLADLERAEPAPLAPPDFAEDLCHDAAEPRLCGDPPGDARREGRRRRHRAARLVRGRLAGRLHPRPRREPAARLDAYAHNPYPLHRLETPTERRLRPLRDDHDGDDRPAAP